MRLAAAAGILHLIPLSCSFSLGKNVNSPFTPHRLPTPLSMSSSDAHSETKTNLTNIADVSKMPLIENVPMKYLSYYTYHAI